MSNKQEDALSCRNAGEASNPRAAAHQGLAKMRFVRSLGVAAVLGEVTCLTAAVLVLPAALYWREGDKR